MKISPWIMTFCLLLSTAFRADAISPALTVNEMSEASELIFVGNVTEKKCRWNSEQRWILTDVTFQIEQVIKGHSDALTITHTFMGGNLDGEVHHLSNTPNFSVGESLLLMVTKHSSTGMSTVTTGAMGKFSEHDFSSNLKNKGNQDTSVTSFERFIEQVQHVAQHAQRSKGKAMNDPDLIQMPHRTCGCSSPDVTSSQSESGRQKFDSPIFLSSLPVTIHTNPSRSQTISDRSTAMMTEWNHYADFFTPKTSSDSWAWANGRFEVAGFVTEEELMEQFGVGSLALSKIGPLMLRK